MSEELKNINVENLSEQLKTNQISRREFVRNAALLGVAVPAAYALASKITGVPFIEEAQASNHLPQGGTFRLGTHVKDISNPHTMSWGGYDSNMTRHVVEYLTWTDDKGITHPYLLEKFSPSADLKTWTLTLRKNVKWSDGSTLTADQVIWNLKRVLTPAVGSSMLGLMKDYMLVEFETGEKDKDGKAVKDMKLWSNNAIEKKGDFTIVLNCKSATLAVPEHLFHYPMAILHPQDNGKFGLGSRGTGPYTMTAFELNKQASFKKRADYWDKANQPALDTLEFIDTGDDPNAANNLLISGQIDGLVTTDPGQYDALSSQKSLQLYSVSTAQTGVMRMNVTNKPFDNPKVRKAMRLAIDNEKVLKIALKDLGTVGGHHHVSPAHPDYAPLPKFRQDIAQAKKLLAEAGFPNGFSTEIYVPNDYAWFLTQAEVAVQMWKEIGVTVKINNIPAANYWDVWTKVPLGVTIWLPRPLGFMVLALAYKTGVPWNESAYSNSEFDKILTTAEGTADLAKRKALMEKLETILQEDGPLVQPVFVNSFTFMNKKVKGFTMHPATYFFGWKIGVAKA
ncbi:MAG: ABC transporter substrate-binding protein [Candidatus Pacebacteria bacterium]|nr:ABC transporter substrate-binding protein [Candidatus Paceibacterota bacterium]